MLPMDGCRCNLTRPLKATRRAMNCSAGAGSNSRRGGRARTSATAARAKETGANNTSLWARFVATLRLPSAAVGKCKAAATQLPCNFAQQVLCQQRARNYLPGANRGRHFGCRPAKPMGSPRVGSNPTGAARAHITAVRPRNLASAASATLTRDALELRNRMRTPA